MQASKKNKLKADKLFKEACKLDESRDNSILDKVLNLYFTAIDLDPSLHEAYTNIGNIFFDQNLFESSKFYYEKALKINPKQAEANYNLGYYYSHHENYDLSIKYYLKCLKYNPNFYDCIFNLALTYHESHNYIKAKEYYLKYLNENTPNPDKWKQFAQNNLDSIINLLRNNIS